MKIENFNPHGFPHFPTEAHLTHMAGWWVTTTSYINAHFNTHTPLAHKAHTDKPTQTHTHRYIQVFRDVKY